MAVNSLSLHLTAQGVNVFNEILATGTAFTISKVELSSNIVPAANPNDWFPDGGIGLPYYIQTSNVVALAAGPNSTFVMDMQLDQTIPLSIAYNAPSVLNGWVGTVSDYIEIGSFALFLTSPSTGNVVPYCIGYFASEPVQKFANSLTTPGNFLDIFNNIEMSPFSASTINYQIDQIVNAQVAYMDYIYHLPVPQLNTSNAYVLADIDVIAFTEYKTWNFTNYIRLASNLAITAISGSQLTSAALYNALPSALQQASQVFIGNLLIGEILDSAGVVKKCFVITASTGNVFTTNVTLPSLVAGDTVMVFLANTYNTLNSYITATQGITAGQSTLTTNTTLTAAQRTVLIGANNVTVTLPIGTSVPTGAVFVVDTQQYTGTLLTPNAVDSIFPAGVGASRYLAQYGVFEYRWDGTYWKWIC